MNRSGWAHHTLRDWRPLFQQLQEGLTAGRAGADPATSPEGSPEALLRHLMEPLTPLLADMTAGSLTGRLARVALGSHGRRSPPRPQRPASPRRAQYRRFRGGLELAARRHLSVGLRALAHLQRGPQRPVRPPAADRALGALLKGLRDQSREDRRIVAGEARRPGPHPGDDRDAHVVYEPGDAAGRNPFGEPGGSRGRPGGLRCSPDGLRRRHHRPGVRADARLRTVRSGRLSGAAV